MLWHAIKTQDHVVGDIGQGMYWQGLDKSPLAHGTMPRAGCPCLTAKRTLLLE